MGAFADERILQEYLKLAGSSISLEEYSDVPFEYTQSLLQKDIDKLYKAEVIYAPLKLLCVHLHAERYDALQANVNFDEIVNMINKLHDEVGLLSSEARTIVDYDNMQHDRFAEGKDGHTSYMEVLGNDSAERFSFHSLAKSIGKRLWLPEHIVTLQTQWQSSFGLPKTAAVGVDGKYLSFKHAAHKTDMSYIIDKVLLTLITNAQFISFDRILPEQPSAEFDAGKLADDWVKLVQPYVSFLQWSRTLPAPTLRTRSVASNTIKLLKV